MPSFIVVVDTLQASIYISIAQGFGIALIGTFIAVFFIYFQGRKDNVNITSPLQKEMNNILLNAPVDIKNNKQKVIEFFLLFFSLFGTIFLIHGVWQIPLMIIIPIVVIGWIIAFYFYKQRVYKLKEIAKQYITIGLKKQANQLTLMLSIGTLIYALNPLYLLPFIVITLGFLGLGPLTIMVLVAGILDSLALPYSPELIVLAITSGSVISVLISPMLLSLIVLSASNKLSLFTNGIKFNWKYSMVFYIVTQIYIQTMVQLS